MFSLRFPIAFAQVPQEVYKKSLKEVLQEIEKRHDIKIQFSESLVREVYVLYPSWRYRIDTEETLTNILFPLDMIFTKTGEKQYQISKYAYHVRPVDEGKKHLEQLISLYKDLPAWESRKAELRKCFLEQMGLSPLPKKTPLNPIYTPKRKMDGYTVENVAIETIPGVFLCGSLYRPAKGKGPFPAVLCTHGHAANSDLNKYGRYRPDHQYRCAMLARMGAVVFSYEMFAWGESRLQVSSEVHRTGLALTMQTLNSIRVVDFLISLPYVDPKRIGITGESGGGTQTFLLTALDDRIAVSVPVVMVSSYFFGGCPCESGLPIHSCSVRVPIMLRLPQWPLHALCLSFLTGATGPSTFLKLNILICRRFMSYMGGRRMLRMFILQTKAMIMVFQSDWPCTVLWQIISD